MSNSTAILCGPKMNPEQRPTRHKFDQSIVKQVSKYLESNNYSGILKVIEDWTVVSLAIITTVYLYNISAAMGVISYCVALIIIGGRQRAIADILHQSSHGAAAKNKYLNWVLGTFFSGYTVLQSFSIYTASHVLSHHPFLGNPQKDPDYIGLISNNICGLNRCSLSTKNYIYSLISPFSSYNYLKYLVTNRIYDRKENKYETVIRLMYWLLILSMTIYNGYGTYLLLFWFIPLISSNVWVGSLLELLEHFPMTDDPNIPISKNRIWSALLKFFLGVHQEGYHLVHHLFPKLPSWNYVSVHKILMKDEVYATFAKNEAVPFQLMDLISKSHVIATQNGFFTQSKQLQNISIQQENGIKYTVGLTQNQSLKPINNNKHIKSVHSAQKDPFMAPFVKGSHICDINTKHRLIFNKYPILENHLLIISKQFIPQKSLLTIHDFMAVNSIFKSLLVNTNRNKNSMVYFNSDSNAGASQKHRHVHILPNCGDYLLLNDTIAQEMNAAQAENHNIIQFYDGYQFLHAAVLLDRNSDAKQLYVYYNLLINFIKKQLNISSFSYNLLMTDKILMIVPRKCGAFVNDQNSKMWYSAAPFAGLIFCDQKYMKIFNKAGFCKMLKYCCYPTISTVNGITQQKCQFDYHKFIKDMMKSLIRTLQKTI